MRWLLRLRIFIIIFLAVGLISAAVLFSVIRAVLPHATAYKNEISQEISRQIGLPVKIGSIDAEIQGFSPRLKLIDVSVFDEENEATLFNFREAFVELDVFSSIRRGELIVADVGLVGADILIEKFSDTEWAIQGVQIARDGKTELPEQLLYVLQNADYLLHDSNIHFQDHTEEKLTLKLSEVNITVENHDNKHAIKLSMNLPELYGHNLFVVATLQGGLGALSGDIYVEANQLKTRQWSKLLGIIYQANPEQLHMDVPFTNQRMEQVSIGDDANSKKFNFWHAYQVDAIVDVDLWITLDNNNIQALTTQLVATNLSISNNKTNKQWKTDYLSTKIRYFYEDKNWNFTVSDFYFGARAQPAWLKPVSLIASYDNQHYHLSADFLPVDDVRAIAEVFLSKGQFPGLDRFMSYQIQADIFNLNLKLPSETPKQQLLEHLELEAAIINFSMFDSTNNIRLSGLDAFLHYDTKRAEINVATQDAVLEIKDLFREPLFAKTLQGDLFIEHQDGKWQLRSDQLQLQTKHINTFSRFNVQLLSPDNIHIDAQTNFYDVYGKYIRHYLPVGVMWPELVDWLDMAVIDGYIPAGSFILQGNLNDFPYYQDNGVFQVLFPLQDAKIQFLENWPLLTEASAMLKFHNQSFFASSVKAKTQNAVISNGSVQILDLDDRHITVSAQAQGKTEDIQSYVYSSPLDAILGDALRLFQVDGDSQVSLTLEIPLNAEANTPEAEIAIDGQIEFLNTVIYFPDLGYEFSDINGVVNFSEDSVSLDSMKVKMDDNWISISADTQNARSGREIVFHLDGVMRADYLLQLYGGLPEGWISGESMWQVDIEIPFEAKDYLVQVKADSMLEGVALQMSERVQKDSDSKIRFSAELDILENEGLQIKAKASTVTDRVNNNESDTVFDLLAVRDEGKFWRLNIDSDFVTGKVGFTEGFGKGTSVQLDLETIDLHALFAGVENDNKQTQALNSSDFPQLNWQAKKVLWDEHVFTDVKVKTSGHEHGMLIDTVSFKGTAMAFDGHGSWSTSRHGLHESVLEGTMTSSNVGDALVGLNFSPSLDHATFTSTFKSKWSAMPHQLTWANVVGSASFEMLDGEMRFVDPGAGRLLGLINIFRLLDRLALDFDDITKEGFVFDSIKGDFEFVNGTGSLQNFDIKSRAAYISMFGGIGLIQQDYDLLMHVRPHTHGLTFAGGALLGGITVGVALALIQKIFDFSIVGHNVYSITGSWDDPKIEEIIQRNLIGYSIHEDDF